MVTKSQFVRFGLYLDPVEVEQARQVGVRNLSGFMRHNLKRYTEAERIRIAQRHARAMRFNIDDEVQVNG